MKEIKIEWYWEVMFFLEKIFKIVYRFIWKIFHKNMYDHPEDIIPKDTIYCYTRNGKNGTHRRYIDINENGHKQWIELPYYGTDTCPFHRNFKYFELCLYNGSDCIDDSCKTCGVNEEEFFERMEREFSDQLGQKE